MPRRFQTDGAGPPGHRETRATLRVVPHTPSMARETATAQSAALAELQRETQGRFSTIDERVGDLDTRVGELAAAVDKSAAAAHKAK